MAQLALSCLGPLQVTLDGRPVAGFKSAKVRALLVFLAVEADRPHHREALAGLLWPEWTDRDALSNLRYALSNLRRVIGDRTSTPPFLLITRDTLQFNRESDYWLDVEAVTDPTLVDRAPATAERLLEIEELTALYRGIFLEGLSVSGCVAFEEWVRLKRNQCAQALLSVLDHLAQSYEDRGEYERARHLAQQQVEMEPWQEKAHRQLMRCLALDGQRSAALAQYQTCCRLLAEELGVEPARETRMLFEQIRDGEFQPPRPITRHSGALAAGCPEYMREQGPDADDRAVFVTREPELAHLQRELDRALSGHGRVVFVVGDAGSGKSALMHEFARRSMEDIPELIVAGGNCNAHTGIGDPYLPFREILGLLTGDVQDRWAAGAITRKHALRLWRILPFVARALVEVGPDLLDTFVPIPALMDRALEATPGAAPWLSRLRERLGGQKPGPAAANPQQSDLFQQVTRVLQALARHSPLVLVIDDMQWADLGSISLLFHLGRNLAGCAILVLAAYRPEDVALGRDGERHPLGRVVNELQREFGDIIVDVGRSGRQEFVDAFIDSEPNRLGASFRQMLFRQTGGHPLFTVELLRGMQERGDLRLDGQGRWVEGAMLAWERLPARVDAVIAERIARLPQPLRAALRAASVEGEVFTAEVVARVLDADERGMLERLSGELDRKHHLIRAHSITRVDGQRLSHYRFGHILFQKHLYGGLDEVERVYLHERVGSVLEQLYGPQEETETSAAIAVQLARHFQEAKIVEKAIHYLHLAGDKAVRLSAYQEAIAHLKRALDLLMTSPDTAGRASKELELQLSLAIAWPGIKGNAHPEVHRIYSRARDLCQRMGETSQLSRVLGGLALYHYVRAEHHRAREFAEKSLRVAQGAGDPLLVASADWCAGFVRFCRGEYAAARTHLEQVIAFYDPARHHNALLALRGSDPGPSARAYLACCLWSLGYPDQARQQSEEALATARELDHPLTLADVLCYACCLFSAMRRDGEALITAAEELIRLSAGVFPAWTGTGINLRGEALVLLGRYDEAIAQIDEGTTMNQARGVRCYLSGAFCASAEAHLHAGRPDEALRVLAEVLAFVEGAGERYWEAELHRLTGICLLAQGDEAGAEVSFLQAIDVARRQSARSWELRATVSLCRLWGRMGRRAEACQRLGEIYGWFTEGQGTTDLVEARELLQALS